MATKKQYADALYYEKKLEKVMSRFEINIDKYNYNWDRFSAYVQFNYKNELYRFELTTEQSNDLSYGSDCFARIVLALEDLARMIERGIYDLSRWIAGMKYLPPVIEIGCPKRYRINLPSEFITRLIILRSIFDSK